MTWYSITFNDSDNEIIMHTETVQDDLDLKEQQANNKNWIVKEIEPPKEFYNS